MGSHFLSGVVDFFLQPQFFPVFKVTVHLLLPFIVALMVFTCTSMGGVSGAFLLLPFQVSALNFTSPAVSPTNLVFNIVAIPSGVYRGGHLLRPGNPPGLGPEGLFGVGGFLGMYCGARLQKFVPGTFICIGLGVIISALALPYILVFFVG
jgi:uncharacterized membrane protein YfcA